MRYFNLQLAPAQNGKGSGGVYTQKELAKQKQLVQAGSVEKPVVQKPVQGAVFEKKEPSKTEYKKPSLKFLLPLGKNYYDIQSLAVKAPKAPAGTKENPNALYERHADRLQKFTGRLNEFLSENKKTIDQLTEKDVLEIYDLNGQNPVDQASAKKVLASIKELKSQFEAKYANTADFESAQTTNQASLRGLADGLFGLETSDYKIYNPKNYKTIDQPKLVAAQAVEEKRTKGEVLTPEQIQIIETAKGEYDKLSYNAQLFMARNASSDLSHANATELLTQLEKSTGVKQENMTVEVKKQTNGKGAAEVSTRPCTTKEKLERYLDIVKNRSNALGKSVDVQRSLAVLQGRYEGLQTTTMITDLSAYKSDPAFSKLEKAYSNEQIKKTLEMYGHALGQVSDKSPTERKSLHNALVAIKTLSEHFESKAWVFDGDEKYNLRLATDILGEIKLLNDADAPNNDPVRQKAAGHVSKMVDHYQENKVSADQSLQSLGALKKFSGEDSLKAQEFHRNICGSMPGLSERISKMGDAEKARYIEILIKFVEGDAVKLDDFMFLSGAGDEKNKPDIKTNVHLLREFLIFSRLTSGKHDDDAFEKFNANMLEGSKAANEKLYQMYSDGEFDDIGLEASDMKVAFDQNLQFTSVFEQIGSGSTVKDMRGKSYTDSAGNPITPKIIKFTDQIDISGSPKIKDTEKAKFIEFSDGILTFAKARKIGGENSLVRNTPVASKENLTSVGRAAFSKSGEVVPGMNDKNNADTINRPALQVGYWMQYVTEVSTGKVDRPQLEMRYLKKSEVKGAIDINDSQKEALKLKREMYRIFEEAMLTHPKDDQVMGLKFSDLQEMVADGKLSKNLLGLMQKYVVFIADPKNPDKTIAMIPDENILPMFEMFHIASRDSQVLFNEGEQYVALKAPQKDKNLFMYVNTIFGNEEMSFKNVVYPGSAKPVGPTQVPAEIGSQPANKSGQMSTETDPAQNVGDATPSDLTKQKA